MNTLRITVKIDQRAALLAGLVLGPTAEMDVSPESLGTYWPRLVARLDMGSTPPQLRRTETGGELLALPAPTVEALLAAYAEEDARDEEDRIERARKNAENDAALTRWESDLPPPEPKDVDIYASADLTSAGRYSDEHAAKKVCSYTGFRSPFFSFFIQLPHSLYPAAPGVEARINTLKARAVDAAKILDEAAYLAAQPQIAAALAAEVARIASEKVAKEAADRARYAERLASGRYEREVGSYNSRRHGQPWIAAVTLDASGKLTYDFGAGDCTAKWGAAGMLIIPCRPGDVIAWGQKDLRNPHKSDHTILRMADDGHMETLDRTAALKALRPAAK